MTLTFPAIPGKSELPDKVVKDLSLNHYYCYNALKSQRIDEDHAALTAEKTGHNGG